MDTQETMMAETNRRGDATFRFLGIPSQVRATAETTGGAFGLVEHWEMPPGFASPYHTHHREDEQFYVLEGEMAFVCDGKWIRGGPGTYVFGPRELAHGFKVVGDKPARMLLQCTPAGFEQFVVELGQPFGDPVGPPDFPKMMETAARYGIDLHGPLPEEPEMSAHTDGGDDLGDLKKLNHRWIEAFNQRDWETERAVRSEDFRAILSGMPEPLNNAGWSGFMHAFTTAFPDSSIQIEDCIAEGDRVMTRWSLTGTHRGDFQGVPASGRSVRFTGLELNRVQDGKFVEHVSQFDLAGLMAQIQPARD